MRKKHSWQKKQLRRKGKQRGKTAKEVREERKKVKFAGPFTYNVLSTERLYRAGIGRKCKLKAAAVEKILRGETATCTPQPVAVVPRTILRKANP